MGPHAAAVEQVMTKYLIATAIAAFAAGSLVVNVAAAPAKHTRRCESFRLDDQGKADIGSLVPLGVAIDDVRQIHVVACD